MERIAAPGILAYKAGDCFANLVSFITEMPAGRDISSATVEGVLQEYVADFAYSATPELANLDLGTKSCYDVAVDISIYLPIVVFNVNGSFLGLQDGSILGIVR